MTLGYTPCWIIIIWPNHWSKNMNLFAIYASVTSLFLLERLAKVTLYGTLATAVPFYNISILCNRNKTKEQIYNFSESSKSRMKRFEEFHEKVRWKGACGSRAAVWPLLGYSQWPVYDHLDWTSSKICLIYYSQIYFYSTFVVVMPKSSNEFPWISIWRLVKPHANYCVDIPKARCLCPAFAESYQLIHVTLSKELVAVHVWNAPDQWHNWLVAGGKPPPRQAKCQNRAPT